MEGLLKKVLEEGEWKSLRFTVYNYLEDKEAYQLNLEQNGYESDYDELEGKMFNESNAVAKRFKAYVENNLQKGNPIISVCVIDDWDNFTIVKPKNVDIHSLLKVD